MNHLSYQFNTLFPTQLTPYFQPPQLIPSYQSSKVDPVRILTTCLSKCEEVLEQSAEVFAEVKESSLLLEICEVEEGRNKLRGREGGEVEGK